jgi:SAM-dependent methyltransferase
VSEPAYALRRVIEVLHTCGVNGWPAYDSLLSATRDGQLDPGDPLVVGFLSHRPGCVSATLDSFRIARALRRAGMEVDVCGEGRCDVTVETDGGRRTVTVQGCWQAGYRVVFAPGLPPRADINTVLPLGELAVDGTTLPAPADPAGVLTAVYGDDWASHQRPFRMRPRAAAAAVDQGRGYGRHRQHWERFYQGRYGVPAPQEPSPFARWVAERCTATGPRPLVVDVGCGNGRDTRLFADLGHEVLALDYASAGIAAARDLLGQRGDRDDRATLRALDLNDLRAVLAHGAQLVHSVEPITLYARFVAHAVDDHARDNLWRLAATSLRRGGRAYVEFRTHRDAVTEHVFEEQHYRRYLVPDEIEVELKRHGGAVVHREEGRGLAPFGSEDPDVCRMVVQWAR